MDYIYFVANNATDILQKFNYLLHACNRTQNNPSRLMTHDAPLSEPPRSLPRAPEPTRVWNREKTFLPN